MFYRRLLHVLQRNRLSRDLDREIAFHLLELTEALIARGMNPDDARREALRRFGSRARHKDDARDANRLVRLESVLADFRYAHRALRRSPGLVVLAIVSLGLGLGAAGAAFSIVAAIRFRALPYPQADGLIVLAESEPNVPEKYWLRTRYESYDIWRSSLRSVNAIGAYAGAENWPSAIIANGVPTTASGRAVSANLPVMLGAQPRFGRLFLDSDDRSGAVPVLVLSYRFWQQAFGSDSTIIGKSVVTSGLARVVIGVLAPEFQWGQSDFLVPLTPAHDEYVRIIAAGAAPELMGRVRTIARLAPGATIERARAEAMARAPQPAHNEKPVIRAVKLRDVSLLNWANYDVVFGAVAALVLLVAIVNLAGLLLVRQLHREREIAVHLSLGASPARVAWQLLAEGLILTSAGGILGIVLAAVLGRVTWASALEPYRLPTGLTPEVNGALVTLLAVLALLATLIVTLGPARRVIQGAARVGLGGFTGAVGGRRRVSTQRALVIAQIVGAVALLATAGVLTRSLVRASGFDVGFDYRRVLAVELVPPHGLQTPAELATFYRPILERLASTPGVESVAAEEYVNSPAPSAGTPLGTMTIEGTGGSRVVTEAGPIASAVDARYFATLGVPIVTGRAFQTYDDPGGVVIVNLAAAKRWWPGESPAGQRIKFGLAQDPTAWRTVVGVVGNGRYTRQLFADPEAPYVYLPMPASTSTGKFIVVRSRALEANSILPSVRAALRSVLPTQPSNVFPVTAVLDEQLAPLRTNTVGILGLAGCGLLLAAIGLYGTISYSVGRRLPEIGIRVAMGAPRARIVSLVAREAAILTISGLAGGLAISVALARFIRAAVMGIEPLSAADGVVVIGVGATLALVAVIATYLPARQALRVDPVDALRSL